MKAYFFDMDGTLIDSEAIWTEAIQVALSERGIEISYAEVLEIELGRAWTDIFAVIKQRWPDAFETIEAMQVVTGAYYEEVCKTRDIGIHSSIDLLKRLSAEGAPVYIVTGSLRSRVEQVAEQYGFSGCLTGIVASGDYAHGKPSPDCYLLAAGLAGVAPSECVVFEDAVAGVLAAKRAGMCCVALARAGAETDASALARIADLTLPDLGDFCQEQLDALPARHCVALGLGGNIGDTGVFFERARQLLELGGFADIRMATARRTKAVNCVPGTPDFLNTAVTGTWRGSALELLSLTQGIERQLGRPSEHSSKESRTLDIDILLFDESLVDEARLTIPHPRMLRRRFVLEPLAEIAPSWRIPPEMLDVRGALARL